MPPLQPHTGGAFRRILILLCIATLGGGAYAFVHLGSFLTHEDPLLKGDAIFVLAGTRMLRPLEAADLYREGYAPLIVMTRDTVEPAVQVVARRGVRMEADAERARDVFLAMGIPGEAIVIPDRIHDSTAAEAVTLREMAERRGWRRIIVVTSRFHLRRAAFAIRRELRRTDLQVVMRASRYDPLHPDQWWTRRAEVRWILSELPKLGAYVLGLGA